ncbi:MAG: hypothetical protein ACYDCG_16765 [Candidatus Acidiferrales bacterium]
MNLKIGLFLGSAAIAGALLSASFSGAQQKQAPVAQANTSYEVNRETTLVGKVISYPADSTLPPIGTHMTIQTVYGPVDVHIGNARLLEQNHFALKAGDSVRVTGEVMSFGQSSTFAARIIEKGSQSVTVRNTKGQVLQMPGVHVPRGAR